MNIPATTAYNHDARAVIGAFAAAECIRVELSERGRDRVPIASCSLATVTSASSPICKLARKLLHLGVDARTPLSIWRGRTKCFDDVPIDRWAELTVEEGGSEPVFRRHKPFPGRAVASLRAKSGVRHGVRRSKDGTAPYEAKITFAAIPARAVGDWPPPDNG